MSQGTSAKERDAGLGLCRLARENVKANEGGVSNDPISWEKDDNPL